MAFALLLAPYSPYHNFHTGIQASSKYYHLMQDARFLISLHVHSTFARSTPGKKCNTLVFRSAGKAIKHGVASANNSVGTVIPLVAGKSHSSALSTDHELPSHALHSADHYPDKVKAQARAHTTHKLSRNLAIKESFSTTTFRSISQRCLWYWSRLSP
jgi:hypothetical protein